jgi:hypothetical protein
MFDLIRQMFAGPKLSEESRDFIAKLATSRIWILAVGLRGTPAVPRDTGPKALNIIAAHRIDVSELGKGDSVFPFNYKQDGKQHRRTKIVNLYSILVPRRSARWTELSGCCFAL